MRPTTRAEAGRQHTASPTPPSPTLALASLDLIWSFACTDWGTSTTHATQRTHGCGRGGRATGRRVWEAGGQGRGLVGGAFDPSVWRGLGRAAATAGPRTGHPGARGAPHTRHLADEVHIERRQRGGAGRVPWLVAAHPVLGARTDGSGEQTIWRVRTCAANWGFCCVYSPAVAPLGRPRLFSIEFGAGTSRDGLE
jgi:hypothetical protein